MKQMCVMNAQYENQLHVLFYEINSICSDPMYGSFLIIWTVLYTMHFTFGFRLWTRVLRTHLNNFLSVVNPSFTNPCTKKNLLQFLSSQIDN